MDISNIHKLGPLCGQTLNVEEISGLELAMQQRKREENLAGKMSFWGKIFGSTADYLIVCSVDPALEFPVKKYWFCVTSNYLLKAAPTLTDEYINIAKKLTTPFLGDPSYFAYNGIEAEAEDPEAPPVERFREMHRLHYIIKKIDDECSILPKGALIVDASKRVIQNAYYTGLSYESALKTSAYLHFRKPLSLQGQLNLVKPGIIKSADFLDCIDKDIPTTMWSIKANECANSVYVYNVYWEGYSFYSILNSAEYGSVYLGNGIPNSDIAFMM